MRISILTCVIGAALSFLSCSSLRKRAAMPDVPIELTIQSNDNDLAFINMNYYQLKLLDLLEDFQSVNLHLAAEDETPELILDIDVTNFTVWPKDERIYRRNFARRIVVGKDQNNKPIYQTVRAAADIVEIRIRANATFKTRLRKRGEQKAFEKSFPSNFRWQSAYIASIQGDARAIDPFASRTPPFEPDEQDIILALSRDEMVRRLSNEIRSYYD